MGRLIAGGTTLTSEGHCSVRLIAANRIGTAVGAPRTYQAGRSENAAGQKVGGAVFCPRMTRDWCSHRRAQEN